MNKIISICSLNAYNISIRITSVMQAFCVAAVLSERFDGSILVCLCLTVVFYMLIIKFYEHVSILVDNFMRQYGTIIYDNAKKELLTIVAKATPRKDVYTAIGVDESTYKKSCIVDCLKNYITTTLADLKFSDKDISLVHECFMQLVDNNITSFTPTYAITRTNSVSQSDLKHLAWNVGEVLGVSGQQRAYFVTTAFKEWFKNTSFDTTIRTLHDIRSGKRILLFTEIEIKDIQQILILPVKNKRI